MLRVIVINPLEAAGFVIEFVQGGLGDVEAIEIADEPLESAVLGVVEEMPGETLRVVPLFGLGDVDPLEEQLFTGMGEHPTEEKARIGHLLPAVPGHLLNEGTFAVHDFIVTEDEDVVLVIGIDHREGRLAVVVLAMDRLVAHVAEGVIHPAHVPFEAEAEPPRVDGTRDAGESGRLLR